MRRLFLVFMFIGIGNIAVPAAAGDTHSLADIRASATELVRTTLALADSDVSITAKNLDPRLKLPLCSQALQTQLPYANNGGSTTLVAVSCKGKQPWSIYVPVTVQIYREVAVANRPLAQGSTLDSADVDMQRMDISRLTGGYLTETSAVIGMVLTRPVQMGRPLLSNLLKAPTIIRRGQTITVLSKQAAFEVRSTGAALMDGAVGERIKVRNHRSKRVIEGTIAQNGVVFVN